MCMYLFVYLLGMAIALGHVHVCEVHNDVHVYYNEPCSLVCECPFDEI